MLWLNPWVIGIFLILQTCQISNKFNLFVQLLEQIVFLFYQVPYTLNLPCIVLSNKYLSLIWLHFCFCWVQVWLLSSPYHPL